MLSSICRTLLPMQKPNLWRQTLIPLSAQLKMPSNFRKRNIDLGHADAYVELIPGRDELVNIRTTLLDAAVATNRTRRDNATQTANAVETNKSSQYSSRHYQRYEQSIPHSFLAEAETRCQLHFQQVWTHFFHR